VAEKGETDGAGSRDLEDAGRVNKRGTTPPIPAPIGDGFFRLRTFACVVMQKTRPTAGNAMPCFGVPHNVLATSVRAAGHPKHTTTTQCNFMKFCVYQRPIA
jgi:hypothetical protein